MAWYRCVGGAGGSLKLRTASGRIATFNTNMVAPFNSLKTDINPVQDLHGYTKPWSGGGGKNKLNCTATTETKNGVTLTVVKNSANQVVQINVSGTASAGVSFTLGTATIEAGTYVLNGYTGGSSVGTKYINYSGIANAYGSNVTSTISETKTTTASLQIASGAETGLTIYPMIRLSSTSADFEPYSNICPISGFSALNVARTGKNFLNIDNFVQGSGYSNLSVSISGSDITVNGYTSAGRFACFYAFTEVGKTYTVKFSASSGITDCRVQFSDTEPTEWISGGTSFFANKTLTFTSTKVWVMLWFELNANATITELQLEQSNQATAYEPYNGQTATVNFGQTVYGGVLDVTNGKLRVTHKSISIDNNSSLYSSGNSAYLNITDAKIVNEYASAISDKYEYNTWSGATNGDNGYFTLYQNTAWSNARLAFNRNGLSLADFITSLTGNPIQVVYELATPTEITTTPENLTAISGENNVYGDTNGDSEVKYLYRE